MPNYGEFGSFEPFLLNIEPFLLAAELFLLAGELFCSTPGDFV